MNNPLQHIMGVEEAAKQWGTTPHYVKKLCGLHKVSAVKIGKTWILDKNQANPLRRATD